MKTKSEFENYFKKEIEPRILASDKAALRFAWNTEIDGMMKDGTLPARAGNWSHPDRFYSTSERPRKERKLKPKIKTIDVHALEWFDRVNGNSYFAGNVVINFGLPDERSVNMPYQYGYGDQYKDAAFELLKKEGLIKDAEDREVFWRYCDRKKILLRTYKAENCKKRELMQFTAN